MLLNSLFNCILIVWRSIVKAEGVIVKNSSIIKKILDVNFLVHHLFVPVLLLTVYCGTFAYVSARYLPAGVNQVFTDRLWKYLLGLLAVLLVLTVLAWVFDKNNRLSFRKFTVDLHPADFLFLLLPLTPVVQYMVNNETILSLADIALTVGFFIIFSSVYIFIIPVLFGFLRSTRVLMALGLAFAVTIINMAILSQQFHWFAEGSQKIQLVYFAVFFLVGLILFHLKNRKYLALVILLYFVANSGFQLISNFNKAQEVAAVPDETLPVLDVTQKPVIAPNIYLLVYDAYVPDETMQAYGIDNRAQEQYLRDQGFVLYPHTYSIGADSVGTMSRVLNMSTSFGGEYRKGVSGDGVVQNALQELGYTTYGIFPTDYMFQGVGSSYDVFFPRIKGGAFWNLASAVLVGEFRFELGFTEQSHDQYVTAKQAVLGDVPRQPIFLYSHTNIPNHSQNSGNCRSEETSLYAERLERANREMRQDLELIHANDPGAIVIVAGDHGPYLTKNCYHTADAYDLAEISRLDIQDRFGTFLAIRWPDGEYTAYDEITVLQDVFPAIFAYLYRDAAWLDWRVEPVTQTPIVISGAAVQNGIIIGGMDDGEPLYLSGK